MKILYNLGILVFVAMANLLALFNSKAKLWVKGRRNWRRKIPAEIINSGRKIWFHCASLGEFEQGRPLIEAIKIRVPDLKVVLTFFSPSGYEVRRDYSFADYICYLPADTPSNASVFIGTINPDMAIFVKYEFWFNYISELHTRKIPVYLISAIFRPEQHFFKWYGSFFRAILEKFEKIFVQDESSLGLLSDCRLSNALLSGDTRYDRVVQIKSAAKDIPALEQFRGCEKLFMAGSSWKQDEEIIARYINLNSEKMKWVFAPHEIERSNIERLEKLLRVKSVRFSQFDESSSDARVMIIDNIGMLSSAYRYAYIAAVGGGFGKGIHNVLEPACWGIPVMFGPDHMKFREAVELIKEGGARTFNSFELFTEILNNWLADDIVYLKSANAASFNIKKNTGATETILGEIFLKI